MSAKHKLERPVLSTTPASGHHKHNVAMPTKTTMEFNSGIFTEGIDYRHERERAWYNKKAVKQKSGRNAMWKYCSKLTLKQENCGSKDPAKASKCSTKHKKIQFHVTVDVGNVGFHLPHSYLSSPVSTFLGRSGTAHQK